MSSIIGIGRVVSSTVSATAVLLFEEGSVGRDGVILKNHHASKKLLVALGGFGGAPYSITTTAHTFLVLPGEALEIAVAKNLGIWVLSEDSTEISFTATEVSS